MRDQYLHEAYELGKKARESKGKADVIESCKEEKNKLRWLFMSQGKLVEHAYQRGPWSKGEANMNIRSWQDLAQFGIQPLTGESCALGLRSLCDVTEKGKDLLTAFFGGNINFVEGTNWNSGANYSVMLPYSIFQDLAVYAVLTACPFGSSARCSRAAILDGTIAGYTDKEWESYAEVYIAASNQMRIKDPKTYGQPIRIFSLQKDSVGGRNVHQMSGRVV